jgi:hypothetical protein
MKDVVLNRFAAFKLNSEGGIPHLYVDTRNYVTVGIGCLLKDLAHAKKEFNATKAYWRVDKQPGVAPTEAMMEADFKACMKLNQELGGGVRARAFAKVTQLRLTDEGINSFTKRKMIKFEATMFEHLSRSQWEEFPADAQFACIAMMWGPGVWKTLVKKYPKLVAAIKNEDFLEAAKQITFKSNGNAKVRKFLNQTYEFCFYNAAASMPKGCRNAQDNKPTYFLNPNLMYWPSKWEYDAESEMAFESDWMPEKV